VTPALERTAVAIAAKLNLACVELLLPHVRTRLVASDVGGEGRAECRAFDRVVAETLGITAAPTSMTRQEFEKLSPAARAANARVGGKISKG
jgi:hypothetical protein